MRRVPCKGLSPNFASKNSIQIEIKKLDLSLDFFFFVIIYSTQKKHMQR